MEASYDVYNMQVLGVINGVENNYFSPRGTHIIAESIVMFVQLMDRFAM